MAQKRKGLDGLIGGIQKDAKQVRISRKEDNSPSASLFVKIPEETKIKLDIYCAKNKKNKQEVITSLINNLPE